MYANSYANHSSMSAVYLLFLLQLFACHIQFPKWTIGAIWTIVEIGHQVKREIVREGWKKKVMRVERGKETK